MKQPKKVTEQEIKSLNEVREGSGGAAFNKQQIKNILRDLHLPTSPTFIALLSMGDKPILVKLNDGTYVFSKLPIHISHLQKIWDLYNIKMEQASNKRYQKSIVAQDTTLEFEIEKAITLLKEQGYKIQKPVIEYIDV